jgi:hypothetical protein
MPYGSELITPRLEWGSNPYRQGIIQGLFPTGIHVISLYPDFKLSSHYGGVSSKAAVIVLNHPPTISF